MNLIGSFFIFILAVLSSFAQDSTKVSSNILKLNILRTGLSYEKSITKTSTLNLDANFSPFFKTDNSGIGSPKFFLNFNGHYRYYYNLEKRTNQGKTISRNSGNYLALGSSYYFKSLGEKKYESFNNGFSTSVVWGLQRTYKSGINININTGVGYNFSNKTINSKIKPIINFTIGWVIFNN